MAMTWRTGVLFAGGLLLGAALGGWGVMKARESAKWADHMGGTAAMGNAPAPASSGGAPATASAAPQVAAARCDTTAIINKGAEDGRESLQSSPRTASKGEVNALITTGKEAAAAGRLRDAEIAFLNACRNAEMLQGEDAALGVADAMYQLGRHYANVAAGGARKQDLVARAQRLLTAAHQTYQARHGAEHEKTRFAQQALGSLQQVAGGSVPAAAPEPRREVAKAQEPKPVIPKAEPPKAQPVPQAAPPVVQAPRPVPQAAAPRPQAAPPVVQAPRPAPPAAAPAPQVAQARPAPPAPAPAPAAKVEAPKPQAAPPVAAKPPPARSAKPSFDCRRARSAAEKIVCADEDLARQDRELAALHKRAESAAADRRAFRRHNDEQWSRRERECQDRECVQRWYTERRAQLEQAARAPQPQQEPRASVATTPRATESPRRTESASPAERPRPAESTRPAERQRPTGPTRLAEPARQAEPAPAAQTRIVERPPITVRRAPAPEPDEVPASPPGTATMGAPTAEGSTGLEQ